MKKRNLYDVLLLTFVFTAAYLLGIHSAMPRESDRTETVSVAVRIYDDTHISAGTVCYDSSGTEMRAISVTEDNVIFSCTGIFYDAGFLSSGGKYLCDNQPISLKIGGEEVAGRIILILRGINP